MRRLAVFYQYLHPDENVSSVHLSELCSGLVERGWNVTAHPCNRNIEDPQLQYPKSETWAGVTLNRIWRPAFNRSSSLGRIASAAWMVLAWSLIALKPGPVPDAIIVGTDPILSVLIARVWRLIRPRTRIVHWCFDLYPEAAYADGLIRKGSFFSRLLESLVGPGYQACDLIVDIGSCMRERIRQYGSTWQSSTLVPWALSEPANVPASGGPERDALFGNATLTLMYSGTFGRAHSFEDVLELMQHLQAEPVHIAFSVKGQRTVALRRAASGDPNVSFIPFAAKSHLEQRLASADIHVVSLRDEWTGMVIPSKFFGALAAGRPVLFCGSAQSALGRWIREFGLGWVLEPGQAAATAEALKHISSDPEAMRALRQHCFDTYHSQFSRQTTLDRWDAELAALLKGHSLTESWMRLANQLK